MNLANLPGEVFELIARRSSSPPPETQPTPSSPLPPPWTAKPAGAARWAAAALHGECERVTSTPEGDRNNALNRAAFRVGQVAHLLDGDPTEALVTAGVVAGLPNRESRATVASGLRAGRLEPRVPVEPWDVEGVNGGAPDAAARAPAKTGKRPEAGAEPTPPGAARPAPPPPQPPPSETPPEVQGGSATTLDAALALLDQARASGDVAFLFTHVDDLAELSLADEAIFLQKAREVFKKGFSKTELARAIQDRRKGKKEEAKKQAAATARAQRQRRREHVSETLLDTATKSKRREIELYADDLTRDPMAIHDDAVAALVTSNTPERLFLRAARMARLGVDEDGQPAIERVGDKELQSELIRSSIFIGRNKAGLPQPVDPPVPTIRTLLGCGNLPFPRLAGIVSAPVLRQDGSMLMQAGYDKATGLYYQADAGLIIPVVPSAPTKEEVTKARELIQEIFCQFPYRNEASRANCIALLLTPFLQPVVDDHRPLCAISAFQPSSGKGELAGACGRVSTGRPPRLTRLRREEEFEKKLAQLMFCGAPFISIDNVKGRLESETLESAITDRRFSDRRLGRNDEGFDVPQNATWCATGNNLELGTEMARRSYPVELDPKHPHPEDREGPRPGEKFKRLPVWVMENRGQLIWAVLTLCRAWFAAGCPRPTLPSFGSFERWQDVVGGVLDVAGIPAFLANRSTLRAEHDEEGRQWRAFVREILRTLGISPFTTRQLKDAVTKSAELRDSLPDELASHLGKDDFIQLLGQRLSKKKCTRLASDGLRLVREEDDSHDKVAQWSVVVGEPEGAL